MMKECVKNDSWPAARGGAAPPAENSARRKM